MEAYHAAPDRADVLFVAEHLRPADKREIKVSYKNPASALIEGSMLGRCVGIYLEDGEPVGLAGWYPHSGYVWMVATPRLRRAAKSFIRQAAWIIKEIAAECGGTLITWSDSRNTLHHKWLRSVGFVREPQSDFRKSGVTFHKHILENA